MSLFHITCLDTFWTDLIKWYSLFTSQFGSSSKLIIVTIGHSNSISRYTYEIQPREMKHVHTKNLYTSMYSSIVKSKSGKTPMSIKADH